MHYLLIYDVSDDYLERRPEYRAEHLRLAWQAAERGDLVLGGAAGEPVEQSVLFFDCESQAVPEAFVQADPYVMNGLVRRWRVLPWHTVVGEQAANPLRPG